MLWEQEETSVEMVSLEPMSLSRTSCRSGCSLCGLLAQQTVQHRSFLGSLWEAGAGVTVPYLGTCTAWTEHFSWGRVPVQVVAACTSSPASSSP